MKTKLIKLFVSIILVITLVLPLSGEVIAKITNTNTGATQSFGITLLHESKVLRDGSKLSFGYGVKNGDNNRNTYRIYAGNSDFENTIVCLQKTGKFPTENSSSGNYQSLGNATIQTLSSAYSNINETKAKQILWLVNNAVLPEDSDELKDIKLSKIFSNFIQNYSSTENAPTLNDIKRYLTEDDLVFAYQCAVWEAENPNSVLNATLLGTNDGTNWDGLVGNDRWGFRGRKGQYILEILRYYTTHYNNENETIVPIASNNAVVPKITVPSSTAYDKSGSRIFVGPFKIESSVAGRTTLDYAVNISFKNEQGNNINLNMQDGDYLLTTSTSSIVNKLKQTKEDLEGKEFYIALPLNTKVRTINIDLPTASKVTSTTGTVWKAASGNNMQPLLSINRTEQDGPQATPATYTFTVNVPSQEPDVALRKYIAYVKRNSENVYVGNENGRIPKQVASTSADAFNNFEYKHRKDPIEVQVGDRVIYGIKLYNEGEIPVQIKQVTDYLPSNGGLEFIRNLSELTYSDAINPVATPAGNKIVYSENIGYIAQLEPGQSHTFYIEFEVTEDAKGKIVTNIAVITDMADESGNPLDNDSDSSKIEPTLPTTDDGWENYNGNNNKSDLTDENYYYKGYEDDDDFEKITVPGSLDLALRKSITSINGQSKDRERVPDTSTLKDSDKTKNTSIFSDVKTPLQVQTGDIVVYTIRVFNEGDVDGYASKIEDVLPEGLGYIVNHNINYENGWSFSGTVNRRKLSTISNATNADRISVASFSRCGTVTTEEDVKNVEVITGPVTLTTTKLQNEKLDAFDKNGTANNGLTIKTVQVACVVLEGNDDATLRNIAAITEYKDKNKNIVNPDFDSDSNNDLSNFDEQNHQDDEDFEKLTLKKTVYDLALKKYVAEVRTATNESKTIAAIQKRNLNVKNVTALKGRTSSEQKLDAIYDFGLGDNIEKSNRPVEVEKGDNVIYTIRIYNEGLTDATCKTLIDKVPTGLKFLPGTNINTTYGWGQATTNNDGTTIISSYLDGKTIPAFDASKADEETQSSFDSTTGIGKDHGLRYREVKVEFQVDTSNPSELMNIAEITADDGDDNDSEPNSKFTKNDDQDDDDYDVIIPMQYDLALKKFVSSLSDATNTSKTIPDEEKRTISISDVTKLNNRAQNSNDTNATYTYQNNLNKENVPVTVNEGDYVTYSIRVYNEGMTDSYATQIKDTFKSDELEFVDTQNNRNYGWGQATTSNGETTISTSYLDGKLIPGFGTAWDGSLPTGLEVDKGVYYREVKVELRVKTAEIKKIKNLAQISVDDGEDNDSKPDGRFDNNKPEDDEDADYIIPMEKYDLALKKYVSTVKDDNGTTKTIPNDQKRNLRITGVDEIENRDPNKEEHNALYTFGNNKTANPVKVQKGDSVVYTIRVYNEGTVDAKVEEIIDFIPEFDINTTENLKEVSADDRTGLQFMPDSTINKKYGWTKNDATANKRAGIRTSYYADTVIPAFDRTKKNQSSFNENSGIGIDMGVSYVELEIEFKVVSSLNKRITNIAEITDDDDPDESDDSTPDNDDPDEDDQDEDYIVTTRFDLALRKFITEIDNKEISNRIPEVDATVLDYDTTETTAKYEHTKEPVVVTKGQTVVYTIRVYNEGTIDGYVSEIKDDVPQGLTFLPNNAINKEYGWKMYDKDGKETNDSSKAVTIKTNYGAKTADDDMLLEKHNEGDDLDYIDFKVAFEVTQDNVTEGNKNIINTAEITECTDDDGNIIKDIDSIPNNNNENEDDLDKEYLLLKYFDLSLLKYVNKVIVTENGVTKETETKYNGSENPEPVVKVEINKKNLANTQVKYVYSIKVTNEGEIEGYAKEIKDRIPAGLAFYEEDNKEYNWKIGEDGIVTTDYLAEKLLKPGDSQTLQIVLRWENSESNLGQKINTAEISKHDNPYGTPDIDSTPDNNKEGEDDQDTAPVILSITTGSTPLYIILTTTIILAILGTGFYMIYKYVVKK